MTDAPENQPFAVSPDALMARLDDMGIAYTLHHHKAVFTADEAAFLQDEIPGCHIKNLFVRDRKEVMALIVLPDEISLDLNAVAPAIGLGRVSFGSPERLWARLGVRPGSVNPFCAMNDTDGVVKVVLHKGVAEADIVVAHPMINTMSLAIGARDLLRFLEAVGHTPQIIDLAQYARCDTA